MSQTSPDLRKKSILIVEDSPDIRDLFSEELCRSGYKTLSCPTVQEALRMLLNQKFDCILLDMRLEKGEGEQIVSTLRNDPRGYNYTTPIIVVSGELKLDLIARIRSQVSSFFVKPFDLPTVVAKVQSICGKS